MSVSEVYEVRRLIQLYFGLLDEQRAWNKRSPWPGKRDLAEVERRLREEATR